MVYAAKGIIIQSSVTVLQPIALLPAGRCHGASFPVKNLPPIMEPQLGYELLRVGEMSVC